MRTTGKISTILTLARMTMEKHRFPHHKVLKKKKHKVAFGLSTHESKRQAPNNSQGEATIRPNRYTSHKNVLVDVFQDISSSQEALKNDQEHSIPGKKPPLECQANETSECRKNLILQIFQEGTAARPEPTVNSVLIISDDKVRLKRRKSVAFADSTDESSAGKKSCTEDARKQKETKHIDAKVVILNAPLESSGCSVGHDDIQHKQQSSKDRSRLSVRKTNEAPCATRAIVRRFPGPAGILPDDVDGNDLVDLDSSDKKISDYDNGYAQVCSQNTMNLFTTGAWQEMKDDLPAYKELPKNATINENAKQYCKAYKKIPYLAGIVQTVDYMHNDPHVILKDISGKVEMVIHHDIVKLNPEALGIGVVLLVRDVGIMFTSKRFVKIIVTSKNLVGVYSGEGGRLVITPHLTTLLQDRANEKREASQIGVPVERNEEQENNLMSQKCESTTIEKPVGKRKNGCMRVETGTSDDSDLDEWHLEKNHSWPGARRDEQDLFKADHFSSSAPMHSPKDLSSYVHFPSKKFKKGDQDKMVGKHHEIEKLEPSSKLEVALRNNSQVILADVSELESPNDTAANPTSSKQVGLSGGGTPSVAHESFLCEGDDGDDLLLLHIDLDEIAASCSTRDR